MIHVDEESLITEAFSDQTTAHLLWMAFRMNFILIMFTSIQLSLSLMYTEYGEGPSLVITEVTSKKRIHPKHFCCSHSIFFALQMSGGLDLVNVDNLHTGNQQQRSGDLVSSFYIYVGNEQVMQKC